MFYFQPYLGKIPILTNIFQLGRNHQLDWVLAFVFPSSEVYSTTFPGEFCSRQASNHLGPLENLRLRHWKKSAYAAATMKWRRCAHPPVLLTQPLATGAPPLCAMEPNNRQLGDVGSRFFGGRTGWWPLTMTSKTGNSTLIGLFREDIGMLWLARLMLRFALITDAISSHIYIPYCGKFCRPSWLISCKYTLLYICQVCFSFGWASGWLSVRTYP